MSWIVKRYFRNLRGPDKLAGNLCDLLPFNTSLASIVISVPGNDSTQALAATAVLGCGFGGRIKFSRWVSAPFLVRLPIRLIPAGTPARP